MLVHARDLQRRGAGPERGRERGRGPGAQQPPQLRAQDAPTLWHRPLVAITPHLENLSRHRSAAGNEGLSLDTGKTPGEQRGNPPPAQPHPKARSRSAPGVSGALGTARDPPPHCYTPQPHPKAPSRSAPGVSGALVQRDFLSAKLRGKG